MSILWSKLMASALLVCCCVPDLLCPYCGRTAKLDNIVDVNALLTEAHHDCPGAWDLLADHLVERMGTTGFTRDGVAEPHSHTYMTPRERLLAVLLRMEEGQDAHTDRDSDGAGGVVPQVRDTGTGWPAGPTPQERTANRGVHRPEVRPVQVGREAERELG
jgi:hypothetical protein